VHRAVAAYAITKWQHFSAWNDFVAVILRLWRHNRNLTLSIDAYGNYSKNNPAQFHPNPIWNDEALDFFKVVARQEQPQQEQQKEDH